ncbi:MAG: cytidylate kinase-like family protein [Clostridiaceae bacterium]
MRNYVITIGREYGSQGMHVGMCLAEMLNIPIYYKDLVKMAAEELGEPVDALMDIDETYSMNVADFLLNKNGGPRSRQDRLFDAEANVIRRLAKTESCIIVGHCASYILRHEPNVINVFIYAPDGVRYQHLLEEYRMTPDATIKMMESVDKQRHNYYDHYTGQKRGSRELRQFMLDSSVLGVEGTAKVLKCIVEEKFL